MRYALPTLFLLLSASAMAQTTQPATKPAAPAQPMTVAILDFESTLPGNPDLGKQAAETLTAMLSGADGLQLVDRANMSKTLTEHELNLSGLVDANQAVKIGKLVGARILVTGKIFTLDKSTFATAKIIGTETTLVEGVLVKVKAGTDTGALLLDLSEKLQARLAEAGPRLVAADAPVHDPLPALKERLSKKQKPVLMVQVQERHVGEAQPANDPPVDTELRMMLADCGFVVVGPAAPASDKLKAEMLVKGEGFSEFAARVQNLRSCTARVELHLVNVADSKSITSVRTTARAADLSENIAGRAALQKAGRDAGLQLLEKLADTLPDAK